MRKPTRTERKLTAAERAFSRSYDAQAERLVVRVKVELVDAPLRAFDRAWDGEEMENFLRVQTVGLATEGLVIGGFSERYANSPEAQAKLLRSTYGKTKRPLIKTLEKRTTYEAAKNYIQGQITANGNTLRTAQKIFKADMTRGTPTKLLEELVRAVKIAHGQKSAEVVRAAEKLIAHTKRLAANGAPTAFLKNSYNALAEKALAGNITAMERALEHAIKQSAKYNAQRIARTELASAYAQAERESIMDDPDIGGSQFLLDARHVIVDECDFYASADLYGLGPGIYPKNEGPVLPIHPNGMSTYVPISTLDIKNPNATMREDAKDRAEKHPAANRIDLEGHVQKWVRVYNPGGSNDA